MKSHIVEQKKNPLLGREEVIMDIEANSAPSFAEAAKIAAGELKASEESLKVRKIDGHYGSAKFRIYVNVYSSKENMEKTEPKKKEKKAK
ncbi:Ribosomal protein S24e [uncultured archaeon]|nr:Ribosomal protein S24e [uncultured archaeon]